MERELFRYIGRSKDSESSEVVEISANFPSSESHKIIHDLEGSLRAIKITLDAIPFDTNPPHAREQKKREQLMNHFARLESVMKNVCLLIKSAANE